MIKFFKKKLNSWNLDKKIFMLVTSLICGISIIMLTLFSAFYISSFTKQSNQIMQNQLSAMTENYKYTLDNYKELAEVLIIDDTIQKFVTSKENENEDYYEIIKNAKNTLRNTLNMYTNMDFIAIISNNSSDIIHKGNITKIMNNFEETYKIDYENSIYSCERGTLRISYNDAYLSNNEKKLKIYMPVYSVTKINKELGLICMIFDSSLFNGISNSNALDIDSEVMIVDNNDLILFSNNVKYEDEKFKYASKINNNRGSFKENNSLYNYHKIEDWNYYLVSRIPLAPMYHDNLLIVGFVILILIFLTYLGLIISKKTIEKTYHPLGDIIEGFKDVANGDMDVKINLKNVGPDFVNLADGFNYMVEEINTLMKQVILEQQQLDEIRFNELQSQIQPHFLYNTLECIHWQAISDGNKEVSILVKSLANYYRSCLNKGEDIISLENELDQINSYLIIQNMRYGDIINIKIDIEYKFNQIMIPKMTLQPIVENAIYHGIRVKEGESGNIIIKAYERENSIDIVISDDGVGMTEEEIQEINIHINNFDDNFGYGIRNVNKRIKILFGEKYGLKYSKNGHGGISVHISLPNTIGGEANV